MLETAILAQGLTPRGAFHPRPENEVPPLDDGRESLTLVMVGNVGSSLWEHFQAAPEARDGLPDPMNRWSERIVTALAADFGGQALFPFGGPPYLPFLRWAQLAEPLAPSPLGMTIHPDHGLWHAYRGALAFPQALKLPPIETRPSPCESCAGKPCLQACPVSAFTAAGYDVAGCATHVASEQGLDCLGLGCRARRACPVARDLHYLPEQARFHMGAFLTARER